MGKMGVEEAAARMDGLFLPDEGWTCDYCGHHNDDIFADKCEKCDRERDEEDEE